MPGRTRSLRRRNPHCVPRPRKSCVGWPRPTPWKFRIPLPLAVTRRPHLVSVPVRAAAANATSSAAAAPQRSLHLRTRTVPCNRPTRCSFEVRRFVPRPSSMPWRQRRHEPRPVADRRRNLPRAHQLRTGIRVPGSIRQVAPSWRTGFLAGGLLQFHLAGPRKKIGACDGAAPARAHRSSRERSSSRGAGPDPRACHARKDRRLGKSGDRPVPSAFPARGRPLVVNGSAARTAVSRVACPVARSRKRRVSRRRHTGSGGTLFRFRRSVARERLRSRDHLGEPRSPDGIGGSADRHRRDHAIRTYRLHLLLAPVSGSLWTAGRSRVPDRRRGALLANHSDGAARAVAWSSADTVGTTS